MTETDDSALIRRLSNGDMAAFEQLYRRYYPMLCRFAKALLKSPEPAEEVVDDVMFYLWDHRDDLSIASLQGYLVRAVRNRSLRHIEQNRQAAAALSVSLSDEGLALAHYLTDEATPMGWVLEQEMQQQLDEVIEALPEECRRVFKLSRDEELTYQQIADRLHISKNTVKYHIKRALKTISTRMGLVTLLFSLFSPYYK